MKWSEFKISGVNLNEVKWNEYECEWEWECAVHSSKATILQDFSLNRTDRKTLLSVSEYIEIFSDEI